MEKKRIAKLLSGIVKVFIGRRGNKDNKRKYKCNICGRMISESKALVHVKAEEYLMKLIQRDHPQWDSKDPSCHECIEYYRKLIKEGKI